jgi:hypothetical protein
MTQLLGRTMRGDGHGTIGQARPVSVPREASVAAAGATLGPR